MKTIRKMEVAWTKVCGVKFNETPYVHPQNGQEYVRWRTVDAYLQEFGVSQPVAKDGFIPENVFYKLCFKAKNKNKERILQ